LNVYIYVGGGHRFVTLLEVDEVCKNVTNSEVDFP